jgi:ribosomal protein S4E
LMGRHIKVDGKVRTDSTFPAGFMGMWIFGWMERDDFAT